MKKKIYIGLIIITLIIVNISFYLYSKYFNNNLKCEFEFIIRYQNQKYSIKPWLDETENCYYVFLPEFANLDDIKIKCNCFVYIDDLRYRNNKNIKNIENDKEYNLRTENFIKKTNTYSNIKFVNSSSISTMFINTATGSMDNIYEDKEYKEKGTMILINTRGDIEYNANLNYIKGRGNSSWTTEKKSFNIQLTNNTNLLEMGESKNWCLISNFHDKSYIRNKIVYDFAKEVGMEYTLDSKFVDIYLNGEYNGVYLLVEKNEISKNRLEISENTNSIEGPYLLEKEFYNRFLKQDKQGFITDKKQAISIRSPKNASKEQISYISDLWQKIEDSAFEENNNDYLNYIDINSWAKYYLLEEVFQNFDSVNASIFFYKKYGDKKIYAGPVWDFDMSMGSIIGKEVFNYWDADTDFVTNKNGFLWDKLLEKEDFYEEVIKQYNEIFIPKIKNLIEYDIDKNKNNIFNAALSDSIRWKNASINSIDKQYFNKEFTLQENCQYIKDFLSRRTKWLSDEWKE